MSAVCRINARCVRWALARAPGGPRWRIHRDAYLFLVSFSQRGVLHRAEGAGGDADGRRGGVSSNVRVACRRVRCDIDIAMPSPCGRPPLEGKTSRLHELPLPCERPAEQICYYKTCVRNGTIAGASTTRPVGLFLVQQWLHGG